MPISSSINVLVEKYKMFQSRGQNFGTFLSSRLYMVGKNHMGTLDIVCFLCLKEQECGGGNLKGKLKIKRDLRRKVRASLSYTL